MANDIVEAFIKERGRRTASLATIDGRLYLNEADVRALIAQLLPEGSVVVPEAEFRIVLSRFEAATQQEAAIADALWSALPAPLPKPGEQIAAEPKCKNPKCYNGYVRRLTETTTYTEVCPDCATPSSVEGRKCVCGLSMHPDKYPVCSHGFTQDPEVNFEFCGNHAPGRHGCGHPRPCHEVATPGTNAGEKQ